jgi:hypothetical protein
LKKDLKRRKKQPSRKKSYQLTLHSKERQQSKRKPRLRRNHLR